MPRPALAGAASGGTLIVGFDQDFVNGQGVGNYKNYSDEACFPPNGIPDGTDFIIYGFGFCFNKAFSLERGTVTIYAATADYNPSVSGPDMDGPGPLGEVTITGDESQCGYCCLPGMLIWTVHGTAIPT